ncbi:hypothetical protein GUITHDRAFT_107536 [Guillardia theta CCMP2712]|uniref:Uncharacterized protein n=1 Tax=Guillardia theta (strain CCMP2712) TaxID=905079 RepID=L1JE29_GUITC|nr:hypothetical protein GUITHDRAFT_107536 [Guillardia theta CCMP2712]EKX46763.1 hypothetical protein GUITHDRAFT_107536 [Guillardia theta CCMP2712]|eukprot:XP_005833743.1 hypothetical protein GUITHDRAFT_107536 [Guillardia theta CCMP2712]
MGYSLMAKQKRLTQKPVVERPDIAVSIVGFFMLYGVIRFWIMWASAFHGLNLLQKYDSRAPDYWQKQKRPLGSLDFNAVWHAVIVPNYKEPLVKLRQTLDTIAYQSIAKQIVVCMAMEARDPKAKETAEILQQEYAHKLGGLCYAIHEVKEGEVAGKSSNENWAARCVKKLMVDRMRINPDYIVITTCDADTFFHPNQFACLTHHFICDGDNRYHRFYIPVTNFMPNVCHVPGICSTRYTVLSIGRMAELGCPISNPFPLAIYSLPLRLAERACYWDPSVIPEDWHMYFRCVFADHGKVACTRMMITVGTEAVEGKGYLDTVKECYDQSVRWQWGAVDFGYLLVQSVCNWKVPLAKRISLLFTAYDHHLLVVVMCVALITAPFLYGKIPVLFNLDFITGQQDLVALKDVMIWTWVVHCIFHYIFMCFSDYSLRTSVLKDRLYFDVSPNHMGVFSRALQLLLFPFADFFLFVVPTIHAHTKLFISSSFNYVPSAKMGCRLTGGSKADDKV